MPGKEWTAASYRPSSRGDDVSICRGLRRLAEQDGRLRPQLAQALERVATTQQQIDERVTSRCEPSASDSSPLEQVQVDGLPSGAPRSFPEGPATRAVERQRRPHRG